MTRTESFSGGRSFAKRDGHRVVVGIRVRGPLATVDWTCPSGSATRAGIAVGSHDDPMLLWLHQALDVAELGCLT